MSKIIIKNSSSLMSKCFILFVLFLGLKLAKVITWSWWWVTAPLWIPWSIIIAMIAIPFFIAGVALFIAGMIFLIAWLRGKTF